MRKKHISLTELIQKYRPLAFDVVFLALLFYLLTGVTDFSKIENNFMLRSWFINTYSELDVKLGNQFFDNSIIGKNHWLIYIGEKSLADFQNSAPYSESELETIQKNLDGLSEKLAAQGIRLFVVVPPNKNTIYPEYLPPQIPVIGPESRLDQVLNYQKERGHVQILDLRPVFFKARGERQIYFKTDTHWNEFGAFIAYQEIIKALRPWFPNLKPHQLDDYELIPAQNTGDIAVNMIKSQALKEDSIHLKPLFTQEYSSMTWYHENQLITTYNLQTRSPDSSLPRLVMYHDSFGTFLQPFLPEHFSQAFFIWGELSDTTFILDEKPDIVILEITERYLDKLLYLPGGN